MTNTPRNPQLQAMAEEIFALTVKVWRDRLASRGRGAGNEISESQFLTLDLLHLHTTLTVGEIQRAIGVLPAQMSRIIRSLETGFDKPLIRCELNQQDKRKIDVALTNAGRKMYDEFRSARLGETQKILCGLPESERAEFVRICCKIKTLYNSRKDGAPVPVDAKAD